VTPSHVLAHSAADLTLTLTLTRDTLARTRTLRRRPSSVRARGCHQVLVNLLISYAFLNIFVDEWWVSVVTYAVVAGMLLGLQEIAVSMSNPFGDDSTDFDTRTLCADAYSNAIAYLAMSARYENAKQFGLMGSEEGIDNPLVNTKAYRVQAQDELSPDKSSRADGYTRMEV
jgi:hypothetical protein